jgi:hypothetical protein
MRRPKTKPTFRHFQRAGCRHNHGYFAHVEQDCVHVLDSASTIRLGFVVVGQHFWPDFIDMRSFTYIENEVRTKRFLMMKVETSCTKRHDVVDGCCVFTEFNDTVFSSTRWFCASYSAFLFFS